MCLVDEALAKKNILAFVQNLHSAEAPAVTPPPPLPSPLPKHTDVSILHITRADHLS